MLQQRFCVVAWILTIFTLVKPHIKLIEICKKCHAVVENPNYSEFSHSRFIRFVSIVHIKWWISWVFRKIVPSIPSFWSILQIKHLSCRFLRKIPIIQGHRVKRQWIVTLCLANIPIIWNLLYQIQIITPKITRLYQFFRVLWQLYTSKIEPMRMDSPPVISTKIWVIWSLCCERLIGCTMCRDY